MPRRRIPIGAVVVDGREGIAVADGPDSRSESAWVGGMGGGQEEDENETAREGNECATGGHAEIFPTRSKVCLREQPNPTSNLGCYGSSGFVELPCHSVTIARTQVFTGFMTSERMRRVA